MKKLIIISLLVTLNTVFAQTGNINTIDNLLLKINQTKNPVEKKQLIEKLKTKLAKRNKKVQEESNAIIKAKSKLPTKTFSLEK